MNSRRILVLDVEESRAEILLTALAAREYIKVVPHDRSKPCPVCKHRFGQPQKITILPEIVELLSEIAEKMQTVKSVILTHDKVSLREVSHHEHGRCIATTRKLVEQAEAFGLLNSYTDGRLRAHHLSPKALSFLSGEKISPSRLIFLEGEIIEKDMTPFGIDDVKLKDRVDKDKMVVRAKRAVAAWPDQIKAFVQNGQAPLL